MARPYAKLRGLMAEQGLTGEDLARKLLLDRTSISKRMNAVTSWRCDEMYTIMKILDQPPEMLHVVFPENGQNESGCSRGRKVG